MTFPLFGLNLIYRFMYLHPIMLMIEEIEKRGGRREKVQVIETATEIRGSESTTKTDKNSRQI